MACNLFGAPVSSTGSLKLQHKGQKSITQKDAAPAVALGMGKNRHNSLKLRAQQASVSEAPVGVETLVGQPINTGTTTITRKQAACQALELRKGTNTFGQIFNALGHPVYFRPDNKDWYGHVSPEVPYPQTIGNGQMGQFRHLKDSVSGVSAGAVIYSAENEDGKKYDIVVAWRNSPTKPTHLAYTDILEAGAEPSWDYIYQTLSRGNSTYTKCFGGLRSIVEWLGCDNPILNITFRMDE